MNAPGVRTGCGRFWPYGLLAVLTVVFLGDVLLGGRTLLMRDTFCDFLPWRMFAAKAWAAGEVPVWNPFTGQGKPFAADPQSAVFYPPHVLFNLFTPARALGISWALHFWIAAAGMFALMRRWRLDIAPALFAAIAFAFSSWMVADVEFFSSFTTAVWGPLVLLGVSRLLEHWAQPDTGAGWGRRLSGSARGIALLALTLALQYLAGHPEVMLQTLLIAGVFVFGWSLQMRKGYALGGASVSIVLAGLLALALTLPQFLLSLEFFQHSERATQVDPGLSVASLPPRQLLGFVMPFLFGTAGYPDKYWSESVFEFWAGTCYVGILPLALAGLALRYLGRGGNGGDTNRKHLTIFALGLVGFGLVMALGRFTPVYQFLFEHVPGFDRIRWPAKYLLTVLYGLALLSGLGFQVVFELREQFIKRRRWIEAGAAAIFLTLLSSSLWAKSRPDMLEHLVGRKIPSSAVRGVQNDFAIAVAFAGVSIAVLSRIIWRARNFRWEIAAVGIAFLNLWLISRAVQPTADAAVYAGGLDASVGALAGDHMQRAHSLDAPAQVWLYGSSEAGTFAWARRAGVGDCWVPFGVRQTWQGGMKLARYKTLHERIAVAPEAEADRIADLLAVRYVVGGGVSLTTLTTAGTNAIRIEERTNCLPRAFVVSKWREVRDSEQVLRQVLAAEFDPHSEAIIEPETAANPRVISPVPVAGDKSLASGLSEVAVKNERSSRIELEVRVERESLLVLSDAWYPGWRAETEGLEVPVWRVNYSARGVFVPAGTHRVIMSYQPWQMRWPVWVSVGAVVVCVVGLRVRAFSSKL